MAKYKRNNGKPWTPAQVKELRQLANGNTPTPVIGFKIGKTPAAIASKAGREGISLKPTNKSPYNRRKKT